MTPADPQFDNWSAGESPISIEYSLVVLEEIRHEVNQGLKKFSRGGVDVGGILYGTREGRKIRITAIRMIACGHLHGPSFALSAEDREMLRQQLAEDSTDPQLAGLICLGWFVSHNRGDLALTESDVDTFSEFFRGPWQVTLVIRPGRSGSMKAAFFVWEPDGTVRADRSYKEFNLPDRLAAVPLPGSRPAAEGRASFRTLPPLSMPARAEPRSAGPLMPAFDASQYVPMPAPAETSTWPWIAGGAFAAVALAVFAWTYFFSTPSLPPAMRLTLIEHEGQLQVQWDPLAGPIVQATRGELRISDGGASQSIPLSLKDLSSGRFLYQRKSGDVEIRLAVANIDGKQVEEASRFLGRAPEPPKNDEMDALLEKSRQLEAEVARLKSENAKQLQRIQELERTRLILQSRLGIQQ
jgi:proteasome lid subunit RPN8/RPN11